MSTKIYDAFRLDVPSLLDAYTLVDSFRHQLIPMREELMARRYAGDMISTLDMLALGHMPDLKDQTNPSLYGFVNNNWHEIERELIKGHRSPLHDFGCEIILYPHEGEIYGQMLVEQSSYREAWFDNPSVVDFHYQNQTDGPDNVSEEEWEARSDIWDAIFNRHPSSTMALCGLTITCAPERGLCNRSTIEELRKAAPSYESRLDKVARQAICDMFLRSSSADIEAFRPSDFINFHYRVRNFLDEERGKAYLAEVKESLDSTNALVRELGEDVVMAKLDDLLKKPPVIPECAVPDNLYERRIPHNLKP
ncbi:hypothetical protein [Thalassospira xiamenensis]|uniref:Uncharacterized protein n=1 Tax=Thalassospira xiamenensis TaxID=220697 RepID=A0A285TLY2_9PROT|nr:hypothetical protein [Thalassospira xiamenensis]SOC21754.1 hypothetical protein SAMN05428964_103479 [Thalassospira xiamenensis]